MAKYLPHLWLMWCAYSKDGAYSEVGAYSKDGAYSEVAKMEMM